MKCFPTGAKSMYLQNFITPTPSLSSRKQRTLKTPVAKENPFPLVKNDFPKKKSLPSLIKINNHFHLYLAGDVKE